MDKYEFSTDGGKSWREVSEHTSIQFYIPGSVIFRIKPRTIKVNGFDVPEPMRDKPDVGYSYFFPAFWSEALYFEAKWYGHDVDKLLISRNICHATKEAAIYHAKAMLGIDPNGGDE